MKLVLHITATESVCVGINMTEGIYEADKEAASLSRVHIHYSKKNRAHEKCVYFVLGLLTRVSTSPDSMASFEEDGHVSLSGGATCDVDDRTFGYILALDMRTASESTRQTQHVKD